MNEEKTIITTRRFEQWWRKVQAWFIMTFATKQDLERINIDTTDLAKEVTSQEISNKLNGVAKESTSQEILDIWDAVSSDSEEIISEEDIHAAVEDIWNITFNS